MSNPFEQRLKKAIQVLRALHDIQNGPPLFKYTEEWNEIMAEAQEVFEENQEYDV